MKGDDKREDHERVDHVREDNGREDHDVGDHERGNMRERILRERIIRGKRSFDRIRRVRIMKLTLKEDLTRDTEKPFWNSPERDRESFM